MCFVHLESSYLCIPYISALCIKLLLLFLFLYQIIFVWKRRYKYSFKQETRMQIMALCVVYCLIDMCSDFINIKVTATVEIILGYLHFQICGITFTFYLKKILMILPYIATKWRNILTGFHLFNSMVLMANLIPIFYEFLTIDPNYLLSCGSMSTVVF